MNANNENKKPVSSNNIFLFLCHFISAEILEAFKALQQATTHLGHVVILLHNESEELPSELQSLPVAPFTLGSLGSLGYQTIGPSLVPGHAHFPVLRFFQNHPGYEYYWLIESDVRYSGDWRTFFDSFQSISTDFLTGHIRSYSEIPKWHWWSLEHPSRHIQLAERLASFNPIFRLSNTALTHLHRELAGGWRGHYEVVLPTLLHHDGFSLLDFGGRGRFTTPEMTDRSYLGAPSDPKGRLTRGTFRYRPPFRRTGCIPDKLYHPVKPLTKVIRWYLSPQAVKFGSTAIFGNLARKLKK